MRKVSNAEPISVDRCRVVARDDLGMSSARSAPLDRLGTLSPSNGQAPTPQKAGGSALSLWLWVATGFLFLGLLWTGMVIATWQADTRTVPLATGEGKP